MPKKWTGFALMSLKSSMNLKTEIVIYLYESKIIFKVLKPV